MVAALSGGAAADVDEAHERLDRTLTALIEARTSAAISRSIERQVELLSLGRESSSHPASPAAYPADVADRSKRRSGVLRPSRVPTATRMRCAPSTRYSLECVAVPMRSRGPACLPAPP
ncbi:MAG: hypothetical protein V3T07_00590 [Myxococcota bacterium]